eukprot:778472-Ditylum_brightwellii.AAC.1
MRAPVTIMLRLYTVKPAAQGQHGMPMHHIHHSPPTVPMHANTRVNKSCSPQANFKVVPSKSPMPQQMVHPTTSERVNKSYPPPININYVPGETPLLCQIEHNYGNTRVPITFDQPPIYNNIKQQIHNPPKANIPHIISPTAAMSPLQIPPTYIPTPKGWARIYQYGQQQPRVIPPEPRITQCNSAQGTNV